MYCTGNSNSKANLTAHSRPGTHGPLKINDGTWNGMLGFGVVSNVYVVLVWQNLAESLVAPCGPVRTVHDLLRTA